MYIPHHHLRLLRRTLGYTVAVVVVLVAVVLGVANQLLPMAERHPERIAQWLSERAGRTVAFDRVDTEWTRRGPLLQLDNLRVGDGAEAFAIGDTEMLVSLYAGLLPGRAFSELRLRGLDLTLERLPDGRWQVRGLPGQEQQAGADPFEALEGLGELQVVGGKLAVIAPALGIDARIPRVDVRLQVHGDRVRAGVRAWPTPQAQPLDAALDFDRRRGDGRVFAGARRADLAAWSPLLHLAGIDVRDGTGRARAWARVRANRVHEVTVDADLRDVALQGAPLGNERPRLAFARVEAKARWQLVDGGWRFDAPRLRFGERGRVQALDGLAVAGGQRYGFAANGIDATPLVRVAGLSDRLSPRLRDWLRAARPRVTLHEIRIAGERGGRLRASARIAGLGIAPVGDSPGLRGLGGRVNGDADGFTLELDADSPMSFEWPSGFGVTHDVKLRGTVSGWRDGPGWRIATPSLDIDGDGYAASARGGLWWQGDGTRPRIDLAAQVHEGSFPVAKGFWVRHVMPAPLVNWLDAALVAGRVEEGRAIVSGDLDDWPFRDRDGRFEASARIVDATLKFQPDWPAAEQFNGGVTFIADGFAVNGRAKVGDVELPELRGGIDHYGGGDLRVHARTRGDARDLLAVLRRSPLEKEHRETLANLTATGPAAATFDLGLPLGRSQPPEIGGTVDLQGARLADARWNLAFSNVRGRAAYSRNGFHADELAVVHDGAPGRLSLRAGPTHVREARNLFEGALEASVGADELIARGPDELAWLRPMLDGRSTWSVGIAVPRGTAGTPAPTLLQLRSNLVGTALDLPAPLRKPAGMPLAATIETPLPLGSGDVRVGLGQLMAVRARTTDGRTGVRVVLGAGRVDEAPPASGLVATGRAASLDALDWIALAHGGGKDDDEGLALQRIDIDAQRLQLLGGTFANTAVEVVPAPNGATAVRVSGASLQGAVLVPAAKGAAVAGRFERVHWRPVASAATTASSGNASATTTSTHPAGRLGTGVATAGAIDDDFDPAAIPPLVFDIEDLRIADARLGSAKLRTRPTADGMRIEQLQARSTVQRLDVTGDWTGRGTSARTRFDAAIASQDFGAVLTAFGFGGRLDGGKGTIQLRAGWPGSPAEASLAVLDGTLTLDARDGRLLEVEPGAGRVIGLLSIAELPRRLTLDFRDFFAKGFSFNRIAGTVQLGDGRARSDDLRIDGPAAAIDIRGAANLRTQHFDQTIEVRPKSANILTAVGALAGGPVGAALGAAANAVLRKPLGQIGAKTYRVTGPWTDPKVEVLSREQSRVSAAAEPAG